MKQHDSYSSDKLKLSKLLFYFFFNQLNQFNICNLLVVKFANELIASSNAVAIYLVQFVF